MSRSRPAAAEAASFYARTTPVQGDGHREEQDAWVEILRVDIKFARTLPLDPLGVLCYAMSCILGVRGHLSMQQTSTGHWIGAKEEIRPARYYYHHTDDERLRNIPLHTLADREMTTSSQRPSAFEERLDQRERACVITNTSPTQACHLLPHSKGDTTIQILGQYRGKDPAVRVHAIDDVRNGIRLTSSLHDGLSDQQFCFLPLPNYAMSLAADDEEQLLPSSSPVRPRIGNFSEERPLSILLTAPDINSGTANVLNRVKLGSACYLYPGRKTNSLWNPPLNPASSKAEEQAFSRAQEEFANTSEESVQIDQPEIWILDIVLAACFLKWFGTDEAVQYVKDLSQVCLSDIETAIARKESDQKETRGARPPPIGAKRTTSPTGSRGQSSKQSRTAKGYQSTSLWDGDLAEQCLRIAMAFPSREAVQNQYKYRQEQLDLEQTSVERLSSWIEGQGNRRRDN